MVSLKSVLKLASVMILAFSSVFICSIFLNYSIDLREVAHLVEGEVQTVIYDAQLIQSKVILACAGGVLGLVCLLVLFFSISRFISDNSAELGVLKALGYSENRLSLGFAKFGISVLASALLAYGAAAAASPLFYKYLIGADLPSFGFGFHILTPLMLVVMPAVVFSAFSVLFAKAVLKKPPLELIGGAKKTKVNKLTLRLQAKEKSGGKGFLSELRRHMLFNNLLLIFFVGFAAFGFGSMIQMAFTMYAVNEDFFMPVVFVAFGLVMGFVTLFLSLTFAVGKNKKYLAMLKAYGYTHSECNRALFGGYRIVTYIGFAVGTGYQFILMKTMTGLFAGAYENLPAVKFSVTGFFITLAIFLAAYELIMLYYKRRIAAIPLREIMQA